METYYVILKEDGTLLAFSSGETILYGDRSEAEEDCSYVSGWKIVELIMRK